jgi:hypothetical protein
MAKQPTPQYSIPEEQPETGTHIRLDQVRSTQLPFNLTYQQLTPEQRGIVNSWYEQVPPGDEPPYPLEGMGSIFNWLRKGQDRLLASGKLYVVATVEPEGKVSTVKAFAVTGSHSPSPEMTKFVSEILLLTKFKPAVCGGRPCRMDFPVFCDFKVQ